MRDLLARVHWVRVNLLGGLALLALPMSPVAATADASMMSKDLSARVSFALKASNGYSLSVSGDRDSVTLVVNGATRAAFYQVPGRSSTRGLWADLGRLGKIAVRFRPSGDLIRRMPPRRCEGRPRVIKGGSFVGTILFRGEHGYTRVDAPRARGRTHTVRHWSCKPRTRGDRGRSKCEERVESTKETVVMNAASKRLGRGFAASASVSSEDSESKDSAEFGPDTAFSAWSFERRRKVKIARFAFIPAGLSAFAYEENLAGATVSPPPPFSGVATFERLPDNSTWRGNLRVSLPGAPNLRLTGKSFEAGLKRPVSTQVTMTCASSGTAISLDALRAGGIESLSGR